MKLITWNLQGANDSDGSKWAIVAAQFIKKNKADIVCLQESGWPLANPDFMRVYAEYIELIPYPTRFKGSKPPDGVNYTQFIWRPFKNGREEDIPIYVFWMETDDDGHRVNLTILSLEKPYYLLYVEPVTVTDTFATRPAIGINLGVPNFFCIHANARTKGGDAPRLIETINERYRVWFAAGDFNKDPDTEWNPAGVIWPPGSATHDNGSWLDYMVAYTGFNRGVVLNKQASDHFPVEYVF